MNFEKPLKQQIESLISRGEVIGEEEFHPSNDGFFPDYVDGPKFDIWMNEISIINEQFLVNHPVYKCIKDIIQNYKSNFSSYEDMMGYLRALCEDDDFFENYEQRKGIAYMSTNELPSNSERLLRDLIDSSNPTECLAGKFKNISYQKDEELRGIIRELKDKGYIDVLWADDLPYHVTLNNSARTYFERVLNRYPAMGENNNDIKTLYDVFISHANFDKINYVDQLKESLDKLGIQIFYDKDTLEWGDKWKDKILEGVQKAEFAIIVISDNFFGREWTEKELQEFLNRQNTSGQKIILPILHNISVSQLQEQYPVVADIQAINSSDFSCDEIAIKFARQLIKRLKSI